MLLLICTCIIVLVAGGKGYPWRIKSRCATSTRSSSGGSHRSLVNGAWPLAERLQREKMLRCVPLRKRNSIRIPLLLTVGSFGIGKIAHSVTSGISESACGVAGSLAINGWQCPLLQAGLTPPSLTAVQPFIPGVTQTRRREKESPAMRVQKNGGVAKNTGLSLWRKLVAHLRWSC